MNSQSVTLCSGGLDGGLDGMSGILNEPRLARLARLVINTFKMARDSMVLVFRIHPHRKPTGVNSV